MPATYILTWNPDLWEMDEDEAAEVIEVTSTGGTSSGMWSVGNRQGGIRPGDLGFLLRQHRDRGVVAAGWFSSEVFQSPHWDGSDRLANYAAIDWTVWLDPSDRLDVEVLRAEVPEMAWDRLQASGSKVPDTADGHLADVWQSHLDGLGLGPLLLPDEVAPTDTFTEGSVSRIMVNRYERDRQARQACIEHWGPECVVCGFNFATTFGRMGEGYIHVHHVVDLAVTGGEYEVDPVNDLRPVCPNCHAMLHRERPAMSVGDLRRRLRSRRGR